MLPIKLDDADLEKDLPKLNDDAEPAKPVEPPTNDEPKPDPDLPKPDEADRVVDQIATEDETLGLNKEPDELAPEEPLVVEKEKGRLKRLLTNKKFWLIFGSVLILTLIFAWLITPSRIFVVNILGLRTDVNITTTTPTDGGKSATLKNVAVAINGTSYKTNDQGKLSVKIPYGQTQIVVTKAGYERTSKDVMLDFDPFFYLFGGKKEDQAARDITFNLKNVGIPLSFTAKDWLTDQPITVGQFSVGDVVAKPDENGLVSLVVPPTDAKTIKISAKFNGQYADRDVELSPTTLNQKVSFAPIGKSYFVSKRTGQYVVYDMNLDGSNLAEVVPASPIETSAIAFSASPSGKFGVLASTRDGVYDQGILVQKLYVVDLQTKKLTPVDQAANFTIWDWSGDTVVYTAKAASGGQVLASVDAAAAKMTKLSSALNYTEVHVSLGSVVYLAGPSNSKELRTVPVPGGTDKHLGNDISVLSQPNFDKFAFQLADGSWHEYNINTNQLKNISAPNSASRQFLASTSADGQSRLAIDKNDSKLALISQPVAGGQNKNLYSGSGIKFVRWVGNTIVFSIVDATQSADYAISLSGGQPKKITDVYGGAN